MEDQIEKKRKKVETKPDVKKAKQKVEIKKVASTPIEPKGFRILFGAKNSRIVAILAKFSFAIRK